MPLWTNTTSSLGDLCYNRDTMQPLKGFEDSYLIDDCGNVLSKFTGRPLFKGDNGRGYLQVHLYRDGKHYHKYVHRIVAQQFLPNSKDLPEINHKDGNKQNNHISNLEWVTSSENKFHAFRTGLSKSYDKRGEANPRSKLTVTDVHVALHILEKFPNVPYVAKLFKVKRSTIQSIKSGKNWGHLAA